MSETDTQEMTLSAQLRGLDERLMTVEHALQQLSEIVGSLKPTFTDEQRERVLAVLDKYFPQGA